MLKMRHQLPSLDSLPALTTKGELASMVYPNFAYDTALPEHWLCTLTDVLEKRQTILGQVVWMYSDAGPMGEPAPLTQEACDLLETLPTN